MPVTDFEARRPDLAGRSALATAPGHDPYDDVTIVRRKAASFGGRPDDPTMRDAVREFVRKYGWRAYALPILIVITIAALFTTARSATPPRETATRHPGASAPVVAPPTAGGNIALKSDTPGANAQNTVLQAAALPAGGAYTATGTGTFRVLPGTSKIVGSGPLHKYSIEVENGITGIDLTKFASLVQTTLSDPRSWSGHGVALQRVDRGPVDFHVSLTSAMTVRTLCGYDIPVETSCFAATDPRTGKTIDRVVLNDARWVRGAAAYVGDVTTYRIYMINHEDGHALGHEHAHDCLGNGLAPAMMQQTIGLKSAVSGKLCAANPWPYPVGVADAPGAEAPDTPQNSEFDLKND
jgi:hypothetical protein